MLYIVFGVLVVGLGTMLLIGLMSGDDTEHIDPQNGQVTRLIE